MNEDGKVSTNRAKTAADHLLGRGTNHHEVAVASRLAQQPVANRAADDIQIKAAGERVGRRVRELSAASAQSIRGAGTWPVTPRPTPEILISNLLAPLAKPVRGQLGHTPGLDAELAEAILHAHAVNRQ